MISKRDVEVALADYKDKISFDWQSDCAIIKKPYTRGDKGKEEWSAINTIVRQDLGGHWVSLGRDSHWVVPLEVVEEREEQSKPVEKGNNGTFGTLHCPYCGKRIDVIFKPKEKEG